MFISQKLYSFSCNKTSLWSGEAKSKQGIKHEKKQIKKEFASSPRLAFYCKTSNVFLGGDKWHNPFLCYCPSLHQGGQRTQLLLMMTCDAAHSKSTISLTYYQRKGGIKSLAYFLHNVFQCRCEKKLGNGSLSLQAWFFEHSFDNVIIVQLSMDLYIIYNGIH
jgi:hypothetical protein